MVHDVHANIMRQFSAMKQQQDRLKRFIHHGKLPTNFPLSTVHVLWQLDQTVLYGEKRRQLVSIVLPLEMMGIHLHNCLHRHRSALNAASPD